MSDTIPRFLLIGTRLLPSAIVTSPDESDALQDQMVAAATVLLRHIRHECIGYDFWWASAKELRATGHRLQGFDVYEYDEVVEPKPIEMLNSREARKLKRGIMCTGFVDIRKTEMPALMEGARTALISYDKA